MSFYPKMCSSIRAFGSRGAWDTMHHHPPPQDSGEKLSAA